MSLQDEIHEQITRPLQEMGERLEAAGATSAGTAIEGTALTLIIDVVLPTLQAQGQAILRLAAELDKAR